MMRPGDWNCPSCQHLNFSRRDSCQRCSDARPGGGDGGAPRRGAGSGSYGFASSYNEAGKSGGGGGSRGGFSDGALRPGDWYCSASACGAHNFASRSSCYKCGEFKDEGAGGAAGLSPVSSGGRGPRGASGLARGVLGKAGSLVTGFAADLDARSTILPAGWSAIAATRLANLITKWLRCESNSSAACVDWSERALAWGGTFVTGRLRR